MTFIASPQQQAIFDFASDGTGSAIVIAVAGSGKSTTMVRMLPLFPETASVHMFAFNTPIAAELKLKIEALGAETGRAFRGVRASTFHSIGYAAIIKKLGLPRGSVCPDGKKVGQLARNLLGDVDYEMYASFACKLVGLAKGQGFGAIVAADEGDWLDLIRHHDMFLDDEDASEERAVEIARQLLRASNEAAKRGSIDFDDQLYLPLLWRCRLWQNDVVIVDEAQDTSPTRRAIAKLALKPGGRLFAVGDPKQGIFSFAGANSDALDLIRTEFNCIDLPLTVSYRCGKAIVREAQKLVPYIEAAPNAPEGVVVDVTLPEALKVLGPKDAILCRNTAPLVELAFKIISQGVGCYLLGREIGTGLVSLIEKQRAKGLANLSDKLERYREREVAKFTAKGEEGKAESINDRILCISTIIDSLPETMRTIPSLITKIKGLFSDGGDVLTLSTMHRSKGKEWDRVGIYRPELCPSKWARQSYQQEQEINLQYVAWTRARTWLGNIRS